jgi:Family of unknown function (DUF6502)
MTTATSPRGQINQLTAFLLRPWARILIRYGVGLNDFIETAKRVYVEVANEYIAAGRGRITDSSVSIMTGVHRKDVHRIQQELDSAAPIPAPASLLDAVHRTWTGQSRFLTRTGQPRALPRRTQSKAAKSSKGPTFEDLLEEVTKGVSPRAVLDDWIRLGAVSLNAKGEVVWSHQEHILGEELDRIRRSVIACTDRIASAMDVITSEEPSHYVHFVRVAYLTEADAQKVKALAKRLSIQIANRINLEATKLEERGRASGKGDQRFSYGMHCYHEPMAALEKRGFKLW